MRTIVLLAIVVALVGGYVLGQQPDRAPSGSDDTNPIVVDQKAKDGIGVINDLLPHVEAQHVVGRYLPVGTDRMLDSTNGTLYRLDDNNKWAEIATRQQPLAR